MDYTKEQLIQNAEQGSAQAQLILGDNLYYGKNGFEKDMAAAVKWYKLAAAQNHVTAVYLLGTCYELGQGTQKNDIEAIRCYYKAAMMGDKVNSLSGLLNYYVRGKVPAQYQAHCMQCFLKYSDSNWVREDLAKIYENGIGVERNYAEAAKWYRLASDNGRISATYKLGLCYEEGRGVQKDLNEARRLYEIAAKRNVKEAQQKLASLIDTSTVPSELSASELSLRGDDYLYGRRGVAQDHNEAIKYYYKAAEKGDMLNLVG